LSWDESLRNIKEKASKSLDDISSEILTIDSMILDILRESHMKVPSFVDINSMHSDATLKFTPLDSKIPFDQYKTNKTSAYDQHQNQNLNQTPMPSKSVSIDSLNKKLVEYEHIGTHPDDSVRILTRND